MSVVIQFKCALDGKITSQLVFEEIERPEGNLFNMLLGNPAKVNKWNSVHAIVREELLCGH